MYFVSKRTKIEDPDMVSRWSFALTRKSLQDLLRHLKEVLRTSCRRGIDDVLKKDCHDYQFRSI